MSDEAAVRHDSVAPHDHLDAQTSFGGASVEEPIKIQENLTLFTRAMSAKTALSEMTVVVMPGTTLLLVCTPQTRGPGLSHAPALARFSANFWPSNSGADSAMMTLR